MTGIRAAGVQFDHGDAFGIIEGVNHFDAVLYGEAEDVGNRHQSP